MPQRAIKLWDTSDERDKYQSLGTYYSVIKTIEELEKAYVKDSVTKQVYQEACSKLLGQYKTAETALVRSTVLSCPAFTIRSLSLTSLL